MEQLSRKFLLLHDRVGTNVERSILSFGLSTKQVPMQVLRGELLEALPEAEQPRDSSKIALGCIERKTLRLECALDCLMRLTEEDVNLLLAISSLEERYQTYMDRIRLDFGKKITMGSRVFVTIKGISKKLPGVVWYKGELSPGGGTNFGVELIEHPGQGTSDGTFRNRQYFSCPRDSGVFVGLDKLSPRNDSEAKSHKKGEGHQSNFSRLKESIMPSSWKGKNEPDLHQGDVEYALKTGQRVVTFLNDERPIRGTVRYIGKDIDRHGKSDTVVGLELDTRDGNCTGKLHGRQLFVCKREYAVYVPIEAVIPEENFDENPVMAKTRRKSDKGDNKQEQIRRDEELAKSLSYNGNSTGQGTMSTKRERANSLEEPARVIKAAGVSSTTDPTEFIEKQRQMLLEMKKSKLSSHHYEDVDMQNDERTDSATKMDFEDRHFEHTLPNSTPRDNIPITEQPGLSGANPNKMYSDYVQIDTEDYQELIRGHEGSKHAAVMHPDARMDGNIKSPLPTEVASDFSPGTSSKPEDNVLSKAPTEIPEIENATPHTEEPASDKTAGADAAQTAVDNPYGFEVDTMVEVPMQGVPVYGVIRWIGHLPQVKNKVVAGLELEDEQTQSACSDGTFNGERYFICPAGRGFFTLLIHCRPDSRFTQNSTGSDSSAHSGKAFGSLPSPSVQGITEPPTTLVDKHCGTMRGLQGHHNSCYLDATLYSMFAFSSVFDTLLHRQKRDTDLPEYEEVQVVLRESIVNPLRVNGFVRADRVLNLRELLDKLSSTAGLVNEEKDPEEFLNSLLQQVLKADPFLHLKSRDVSEKDSEGAFFYQIITEKDETVKIAQVQQLLEQSFISADIILSEVPSCLILQMPRFGSRYKMYDMILPNLELDVTNIVENVPRECTMCGETVARFECKSCFTKRMFGNESGIASYCVGCSGRMHSHRTRQDHKPRPLLLPRQYDSKMRSLDKQKMELFAVVCIETSHYVAFVKCGVGPDAPWCFFDSMADRKGERNGYNIPAVTRCPEALEWLSKDPGDIVAAKEKGEIPEKVRRLLGDGYLCMYQNLDMTMYK